MRVGVCDDDERMSSELVRILKEYEVLNGRSISVDVFENGVDILETSHLYELIFMDVLMPKCNGIDVVALIRERNCYSEIVFVTTHESFMRRAFKVKAFGYVVKPFVSDDIFYELDQFFMYYDDKSIQDSCRTVTFSINKQEKVLKLDDICYFEYTRNSGVKIVTPFERLFVRLSMKSILNMLGDSNFYSPHKSFIVNLKYIHTIQNYDIILEDDSIIPIAQKRAKDFKISYNKFLREL